MNYVVAVGQKIRITPAFGPAARRAVVLTVAAVALGASLAMTDPSETARTLTRSGSDLAELLRFMAVLKGAMVLATLGAVAWRLTLPVTLPRFMLYTVSVTSMAAGPGLIWGLVHVGLGAIVLHAGLAACLVLLWRDPAVVAWASDLAAVRTSDRERFHLRRRISDD